MSRTFQVKSVPSTWFENNGRRLDCGPYVSGAIEARELLRKLHCRKESLQFLTEGIFHAGRESRLWVDSLEYGVPFLGSTDILASDLSSLSFISRKQVVSNPQFTVREGWTLITRSGTIGRMAYARADMDGFACSEHVMRVVPDVNKVLPGYLYAYISSIFGLPIVLSGTYGSIIQSIEPSHVADLPVPRLGKVEDRAHDLVQRAADAHVDSVELRRQAGSMINRLCAFPERLAPKARVFTCTSTTASAVIARMDSTFHNPIAQRATDLVRANDGCALRDTGILGYESNRMKQVFVGEDYGTPFVTSSGIFLKNISPGRYLQRQLLGEDESWRIDQNDTLIARSGQVGGIIGRGVWADSRLDGFAASPHILRLRPTHEECPPGYVYAFLCLTDVGYQLLARTAAGSSIPFLPLDAVLDVEIPMAPSLKQKLEIDALIRRSGDLRKQSQMLEHEAVALVETAIAEGGR